VSDTIVFSMQLGQRNILHKSMHKVYVGKTVQ